MVSRALPLLAGLTLVAQAPLWARDCMPAPPVETMLQAGQIAVKVVKSHRATIAKIIPLPLETYAEAIRKRSSVLVANVLLNEDTRLRIYEKPTEKYSAFGSTIALSTKGAVRTFDIARLFSDNSLSLRYLSTLPTEDGVTLVILSYFGQPSASRQGFIVIRVNDRTVSVSRLPLTVYGKVSIARDGADAIDLWTADQREVQGPMPKTHYFVRSCRWAIKEYHCAKQLRDNGEWSPNSVIYPGVEVRS